MTGTVKERIKTGDLLSSRERQTRMIISQICQRQGMKSKNKSISFRSPIELKSREKEKKELDYRTPPWGAAKTERRVTVPEEKYSM